MLADTKPFVLDLEEAYIDVLDRWALGPSRFSGAARRVTTDALNITRYKIMSGTRAALNIPMGEKITLGDVLKLTSQQLREMKGVGPAARKVLESFLRAIHSKLADGWPYKNKIPTSR